jgi:hypothetical protein
MLCRCHTAVLATMRRDVDGNERGNGGDYVFAGSPEKDFLSGHEAAIAISI